MENSWYENATEGLIMSFSGWRKILTPHHSHVDNAHVQIHDLMMIYYATKAYVSTISQELSKSPEEHLTIALGCDTRPSGALLLRTAYTALSHLQCNITVIGIVPGPAIMAYVHHHADGFIYFTASHNPPQYNGIKFGDNSGKVLSVTHANKVIETFHAQARSSDGDVHHISKSITAHTNNISSSHPNILDSISPSLLQDVCSAYESRVYSGVFRYLKNPQTSVREKMAAYTTQEQQTLGIVWDPNGGTRAWDYDTQTLQRIGMHVHSINTVMGVYHHAIIPEGSSLDAAAVTLQRLNRRQGTVANTHWIFAVVCDCDGDRGNIVFSYDDNKIICLSPQKVFALVLTIELAWERLHNPEAKLAVVVNGASSLICDTIASRYNAHIYRSEVGETNVVELAQKLRTQGYTIPIVGEASNGGNITHPSTVRDPLSTTLSLLKGLLWYKEMKLSPKNNNAMPTLMSLMNSLPPATTTATEDDVAKFQLPDLPFSQITQRIIAPLPNAIQEFYDIFQAYDLLVHNFICENKSGIHCVAIDPTTVHTQTIDSGSISIYFLDSDSTPIGFVWLRPSATEPVVRLLADVLGDTRYSNALERALIKQWRTYLTRMLY